MTTKEKKALLVELIELMLYCGYDISDMVGIPLSKFNFNGGVQSAIESYKKEKQKIDN